MLHLPGRAVDRAAQALVGTTAADVGHRLVDLGVAAGTFTVWDRPLTESVYGGIAWLQDLGFGPN